MALAAIFYFRQVYSFCRLINKNKLQWIHLIMCKEHTLSGSTNLVCRKHPTLCFWYAKYLLLTSWLNVQKQPFATFTLWTAALLKGDSDTGVLYEYCKMFRYSFFIEHLWWLDIYFSNLRKCFFRIVPDSLF